MNCTFITGATGGIGKAFAKECALLGNNLFLTGRSQEKLQTLATEIQTKYGVKTFIYACDLTSEIERNAMVEYVKANGLVIDRLINVAGVDIQKAFTEYTAQKVLFQIRVNVESTISLTHELLKIRASEMEILTISSMSGVTPMPYFALYSATKDMLTNFFTSLHYELKDSGVKVTTVLPGGVYTRPDVIQDIRGQGLWGKLSAKQPEFVAKKSLKKVVKNQYIYIPGFFNKLLYVIIKLTPKRLVTKFIAHRWKKQTKDAF